MKRIAARFLGLDVHLREVTSNASWSLVIMAAGVGASFAFSVALARSLGAESAGVYYLAFTIVSLSAMFGGLGLERVVVRFVAGARADEAWGRILGVQRRALSIALIASTVVTVATFLGAPLIMEHALSKPEATDALRIMSLAIVPTVLAILYGHGLQGLRNIRSAMAIRILWTRVLTIVIFLAVALPFGVNGAASALVAASILTAMIGAMHWRSATRNQGVSQVESVRSRELTSRGTPLLWAALMNRTPTFMPALLLGFWVSTADLGIYFIAQRIAFLLGLPLIAINSIVLPMLAGFHQRDDTASIERVARGSAKLAAAVCLPFIAALLLLPGWILSVMGEDFRSGASVLAILAAGQYINVATGSVSAVLTMTGRERLVRNITTGAAVVNVVLCLVLIPVLGILGAAIATAIAMAGQNIVAAIVVWRTMGFWTLPFIPRSRTSGESGG